jgi:solute:Na+ symporter, SSS family
LVTIFTPSESKEVLRAFYKKIQPGGPGWKSVLEDAEKESITLTDSDAGWTVPSGIIAMLLGCLMIYSIMFATGYFIYGDYQLALPLSALAIVAAFFLIKTWKKIRVKIL